MENDAQMKLRLPHELRETITALAKQNNRSMNSEIVARLEASIRGETELENMSEAMAQVFEGVTATPRFKQVAEKMREEIFKAIPELAFIDYEDGKPRLKGKE